jgi:hypothetical protein
MTDSPACHSWAVLAREELAARWRAASAAKPSAFPIPADWAPAEPHDRQLLLEWQQFRCAVCASSGVDLVEDHDWNTGLTRGFLCESCNSREGHAGDVEPWTAYRQNPPTKLLGMTIQYVNPFGGPTTRPAAGEEAKKRTAGMLHVPYVAPAAPA